MGLFVLLLIIGLIAGTDEEKKDAGNAESNASMPASTSTSTGTSQAGRVLNVTTPSGWTARDLQAPRKGKVFALEAADLTRDLPRGPRARVEVIDSSSAMRPEDVLKGFQGSPGPSKTEPVGEPSIGSDGAVRMALVQTYGNDSYAVGYIVIKTSAGSSILVTLDAPLSIFETHRATFDTLVRSISYR